MIGKEIEAALNNQISAEANSSHLYLAMASWAETRGYIESNPFRKIQIPNNLKKTNDRIP